MSSILKSVLCINILMFSSLSMAQTQELINTEDCEELVLSLKDDLVSWFGQTDAASTIFSDLPLSQAQQNINIMLEQMQTTRVQCTHEPLILSGHEKVCINNEDYIVCNARQLSLHDNDDLLMLVHHEYAGLAGIEITNSQGESNYQWSERIFSHADEIIQNPAPRTFYFPRDPLSRRFFYYPIESRDQRLVAQDFCEKVGYKKFENFGHSDFLVPDQRINLWDGSYYPIQDVRFAGREVLESIGFIYGEDFEIDETQIVMTNLFFVPLTQFRSLFLNEQSSSSGDVHYYVDEVSVLYFRFFGSIRCSM